MFAVQVPEDPTEPLPPNSHQKRALLRAVLVRVGEMGRDATTSAVVTASDANGQVGQVS